MGEADAEGRVAPLISWLSILMQLLWDLELLTGVGLGLFWPPWAGVYGQRDQTQHTRNQCNQSCGRNLDGDSKRLASVVSRGTVCHPGGLEGEGKWAMHGLCDLQA